MKKDEYDEAMRLAAQSSPTWKRMPPGHRNKETDSVKDKLKKAAGGESHKMKKNGKWCSTRLQSPCCRTTSRRIDNGDRVESPKGGPMEKYARDKKDKKRK